MSELALQLIEEEKINQTGSLDLSNRNLNHIPLEILDLFWLKVLNISKNNISDISYIQNFKELKYLSLSNNNISDISILDSLTKIYHLDLSKNNISDFSAINRFSLLKNLIIHNNIITDLSFLAKLNTLTFLHLGNNKIINISPLKNLENLEQLYLRDNKKIKDYSPLENLKKLKTLNLRGNNIKDISFLKNLKFLDTLNLRNNNISNLNPLKGLTNLDFIHLRENNIQNIVYLLPLLKKGVEIGLSPKVGLKKININNNPITTPPLEIVEQGNQAIINYFKELEQGEVPLYECKLLIIGEGGAGKTSLARKLDNENTPLPEENESTKGIDILHYGFTTREGQDFRINIWDFGGQEIYHATHQFFLTKRSLYILLDDTRKDDKTVNDASFNYWLQVVELLSENSPVLIVQNEKSDRSKTLDLKSMQGQFENIIGSKATNLLTCRGLAEVRQAIEHHVQQLPHVGEMLPKQWVEIRNELKKLAPAKDHITIEQYFDICAAHKIPEEKRALMLSSYLHDLGAFLHFQEDMVLRNLFVLNNTWATDAVYKVLDDEEVKRNFGKFTHAELENIWSGARYKYKQPQLLALMEKFQLCYRLKDTAAPTYLAPQLLQIETPDFEWDYSENLTLRFEYDFMPKGILSRFIVRMNRYVEEPDKAWRSGVFLQRQNTIALVRETYGNQEIVVRVKGTHAKELMTLIVEDFDTMHDGYGNKLKVKKWIPCICSQCVELETLNFYDFKNLRNRQEKGKRTIECDNSFEVVNVNALLDGIFVQKIDVDFEIEKPVVIPQPKKENMKKIELFLASSNELADERKEVRLWIADENKRLFEKGIFLNLNIWEDFLNSMSETRLQDEYNKAILKSDIFISLFGTKAGEFSVEEFDVAHKNFKENGQPKFIFTYFKDMQISTSSANLDHLITLRDFKKKVSDLGHFYTNYKSTDDLLRQLKIQLDKILTEMKIS